MASKQWNWWNNLLNLRESIIREQDFVAAGTIKTSVFGHEKLRQISLAKNQPQLPVLPCSRIHLGPLSKIPARVYLFFWPLKGEIFANLSADHYIEDKYYKDSGLEMIGI